MSFNALVVDDEPLAREHLKSMLSASGVKIVADAGNVAEALERVEDLHPDAVFLDIQMPGVSGVNMARAITQMDTPPIVVFVTGYSEYALEAFEHGALDYLVKPVSEERLATAIQRIRARLAETAPKRPVERVATTRTDEPVTRLPVRVDYAVKLLRVEDIIVANARDKRVYVTTRDGVESRTYYTLSQLETMLSPDRFARIHDSYLVSVESIDELVYLGGHTYEVKLTGGAMLPVGRRRFADLKRKLGLGGA